MKSVNVHWSIFKVIVILKWRGYLVPGTGEMTHDRVMTRHRRGYFKRDGASYDTRSLDSDDLSKWGGATDDVTCQS